MYTPNKKYNNSHNFHSIQLAIIGVDGSGKSSCFARVTEKLQKNNKAAIGDEVIVVKNNKPVKPKLIFLKIKMFLGRKVKQLKNRKLYRLFKFTELLLRVKLMYAIDRKYSPGIIVTDGSPLINVLGWGHYYCPEIYSKDLCKEVIKYMTGMKIPKNRKAFFKKHSPEVLITNILGIKFHIPELVFFLIVSPEEAVERIKRRHEDIQSHETEAFLSKLQESYMMVCDILKETRVFHINTNDKTIDNVVEEVLNKIN